MPQQTKQELLFEAAVNGCVESIISLTGSGKYSQIVYNRTLSLASEYGYLEIVKILLQYVIDIHSYEDEALRWAAENGHTEVVKTLNEHGADPQAKNDYPLIMAASHRHDEVVKILLAHGVDIHAQNDKAFMAAIENGQNSTVCLLIEHGANPKHRQNAGLILAAESGNSEAVQFFITECECDPISIINRKKCYPNIKEWCEKFIKSQELADSLDNSLSIKTDSHKHKV